MLPSFNSNLFLISSRPKSLSTLLGQFIANTKYDDLPSDIVVASKERILDILSAATAGSRYWEYNDDIIASMDDIWGDGVATVMGRKAKKPFASAAFINTAFAVSNLSPTTLKPISSKLSLVSCKPFTPLSKLWLCDIVTKLIGHTHSIFAMKKFEGSSKCQLASLSNDGSIRIWDVNNSKLGAVVATAMEGFTSFDCSIYDECSICIGGTDTGITRTWFFLKSLRKAGFRIVNPDFYPILIRFDPGTNNLILVQKTNTKDNSQTSFQDNICIYKLNV